MPSPSALSMYLFGVSAFALGVASLINPALSPVVQQMPAAVVATSAPSLAANSMAATAMGIYYTLVAYQENKVFFLATVPVRLTSCVLFCQGGPGWVEAGIWEGAGAFATAAALLFEYLYPTKSRSAQAQKKGQ